MKVNNRGWLLIRWLNVALRIDEQLKKPSAIYVLVNAAFLFVCLGFFVACFFCCFLFWYLQAIKNRY